MPSFLDRMSSTDEGESLIQALLSSSGLDVIPFGQKNLLKEVDDFSVGGILKKLLVRNFDIENHAPGFMVKFSPDLIVTGRETEPFLIDVKVSKTPVLFESKIESIRAESGKPSLQGCDIGVIEREAWDVYGRFFPPSKVAICYMAPYTKNKVSIQWRDKVECLFRFADDFNPNATGSKTPHVNVNLGSMKSLDSFFSDLGISLRPELLTVLLSTVEKWPMEKPSGKVSWSQFRGALRRYSADVPTLTAKFPDQLGGVLDVTMANQLPLGKKRVRDPVEV
jgi:hypothetical protein